MTFSRQFFKTIKFLYFTITEIQNVIKAFIYITRYSWILNLTIRSCVNSIQSISIDFVKILKRCAMKQHLFFTGDASIFFYHSFAFQVVQFINFFILYSFDRDDVISGSCTECCFNILVFLTVSGQFELVIFLFILCFNPVRWYCRNLKEYNFSS